MLILSRSLPSLKFPVQSSTKDHELLADRPKHAPNKEDHDDSRIAAKNKTPGNDPQIQRTALTSLSGDI